MLAHSQIASVFNSSPFPSLILYSDPHFTIAGVNRAYLDATGAMEGDIIGQSLFGDNPGEGSTAGDRALKDSLEQVLATKAPDRMSIRQYRLPHSTSGAAEPEYRLPVNTPVLNEKEEITFILFTAADITDNDLLLKDKRAKWQQELEEKQRLLDKAYQLARIGTWEFDMRMHELKWSRMTKEVHGFGPDYQPDVESTIALFKKGINRDTFAKAARNAIDHEQPFDVELKIISGQGDERWIRATGEPEYRDGVCTRFYGISQDVSGRRKAEEDLQLSEQRFKSLVQDGSDLIAILDEEANFVYVSPTSETVLGKSSDDYIGTYALDYVHEDDKNSIAETLFNLPSAKRVQIPPYRFMDGEGNWRWLETTLTNMTEDPAVGGMVANSRDITRQKLQQQQNLESLKEKETLLAEIHHRVKNNLAVVSGMMQLQASEEENSEIINKLFDGIIRIKTMANIHEQLYQSNSFSRLEFAANIRSLVLNIQKTLQSKAPIHIDFHCEPVQLNINQAIPCSLIVNEVVTNIFKHAFPEEKEGAIVIRLSEREKPNHLHLSIKDNGVGLSGNFDVAESSSLGLSLIDVLSQQLSAEYTYEPYDEGTVFTIRFEKDELKGIGNSFLM